MNTFLQDYDLFSKARHEAFNCHIEQQNHLIREFESSKYSQKKRVAGDDYKQTDVDKKIVRGVINYFKDLKGFKLYSIYSYSFENSYAQALQQLLLERRTSLSLKGRVFLICAFDPGSLYSLCPKEVALRVLMFEYLLNDLPDCCTFQVEIWRLLRSKGIKKEKILSEFRRAKVKKTNVENKSKLRNKDDLKLEGEKKCLIQ